MVLPTFFKRRTSRHTSKRRQSLSNSKPNYDSLERRNLLATFLVTTADDVVNADDGLLSLREAVIAANTNEVFSDAPAGEVEGDRIIFEAGGLGGDPSDIQLLTEGELEITDDLVVVGRSSETSAWTQIEAGFSSRIFNVNTTERVSFRTLSFVSGQADVGGLVLIQPGSDVVVVGSNFSGGQAEQGGAIDVVDSLLYVRDSQFEGNASENGGGAIHAVSSDVRVVASFISDNQTDGSGGAILAAGGNLGLYDSSFGNNGGNVANDSGGAVYVVGTDSEEGLLVSSSIFGNNDSEFGGAIFAGENTSSFILSTSLFFDNGTIEGEGVGSFGGAIYSEGNGLYITDSNFTGNRGSNSAAILTLASYSNFRDIDVTENQTSGNGGGIAFGGDEAYVSDSTISENVAGESGGGVVIGKVNENSPRVVFRRTTIADNEAGISGGGIRTGQDSVVRLFGSSVTGNAAEQSGGGVWAKEADLLVTGSTIAFNSSGLHGGGVFAEGGTTLFFDASVSSNEAEGNAGGLRIEEGFARLQNTETILNSSRGAGGAIDVRSSTVVLIGGEVSFNQSVDGSFGSRAGAVNIVSDAKMFVRGGTRFESNSAQSFGGAIQVTGLLSVQDAEFVSNSAGSGGAIFMHEDGLAFFERTLFMANTAQDDGAAIFVRGQFFGDPVLILTDSTITENEVTDNEDGQPVIVSETVFWRVSGGSNSDNTPNDGVGVV
jgi:predicted outer membrane repeat protein